MATAALAPSGFYVYAHTRNDTGEIFYVGKGRGSRVKTKRHHNAYWMRIANKHGFAVKVLFSGLAEACAFSLEKSVIATLRNRGARLVNMTDGGEGPSGFKPSEETKIRQRAAKLGRQLSAEHREKIKAAHVGRKVTEAHRQAMRDRVFSESHKASLRASASARQQTAETKAKLSVLKTGLKASAETKRKMSAAQSGRNNKHFSSDIHTFVHDEHGVRTCTQYDLRIEFGLPHSNLSRLVKGKRSVVHGWRMLNPGG